MKKIKERKKVLRVLHTDIIIIIIVIMDTYHCVYYHALYIYFKPIRREHYTSNYLKVNVIL